MSKVPKSYTATMPYNAKSALVLNKAMYCVNEKEFQGHEPKKLVACQFSLEGDSCTIMFRQIFKTETTIPGSDKVLKNYNTFNFDELTNEGLGKLEPIGRESAATEAS